MNKIPDTLILIGSGSSVKEGISKGLWDKIQNKFTLGLNFSFNHFNSTALGFVDHNFYEENKEKLDKLPLVLGAEHRKLNNTSENVIKLPRSSKYCRDGVRQGFYKTSLSGLYFLSFAIWLLDVGTIYMIGMDFGAPMAIDFPKRKVEVDTDVHGKVITHYYQEEGKIKSRGFGKLNFYNSRRMKDFYKVYENEKKVKIYNVSKISKIDVFEKITYDEFFSKLDNVNYNQDEIRESVKNKLL